MTRVQPSRRQWADATRAETESLCRRLAAPDLSGTPLYVVNKSALPAEFRDGCTTGMTGAFIDVIARPAVEQWEGRGVAAVIDDEWAWHYAATLIGVCGNAAHAELAREVYIAIALHELAHLSVADFYRSVPNDPALAEAAVLNYRRSLAGETPPNAGPGAVIPFAFHGWDFIRVALHLCHRAANQARVFVAWPDVIDHHAYRVSPPWKYRAALGREPQRMERVPISQVNRTRPPTAFARLWRSDVTDWLNSTNSIEAA